MRKILSAVLAAMLLGILSGCDQNVPADDSQKLNIVTTIFPEYDWVRQILGDHAEDASITMLLDSGVDLHSYQPTADDMIRIASCDMFIYVGGESDSWVDAALAGAANQNRVVINLMEVLGDAVKEEEIVEGMEHEEEPEGEGENEDGHHDEAHAHESDEHVWLSVKNAKVICAYIAQQLGQIDAENKDAYTANADRYIALLDELDTQYQAVADAAAFDTLLFGDRFPFRYLVDDYGISYYAAFSGCSAETEASFETIAFLAGKVDELGLTCVMTIEGTDHSIAQTVIQNTATKDQSILALDSMQSVTSGDVEAGTTYLSIMENNLEVLKDALNGKER